MTLKETVEAASLPFFNSKLVAVRLTWVVVMLFALCGMIYQMVETVQQYNDNPTATDMGIVVMKDFPSVTLCLSSFVSAAQAVAAGFRSGTELAYALKMLENPYTTFADTEGVTEDEIEWFHNELMNNYATYSDLLYEITFGMADRAKVLCKYCKNTTETHMIIKSHGVCHRFEPGELEDTSIRGSHNVEFVISLSSPTLDESDALAQLGYSEGTGGTDGSGGGSVDGGGGGLDGGSGGLDGGSGGLDGGSGGLDGGPGGDGAPGGDGPMGGSGPTSGKRKKRSPQVTMDVMDFSESYDHDTDGKTYGIYFGDDASYFDPIHLLSLSVQNNYFVLLDVVRMKRLSKTTGCNSTLSGAQYRSCRTECRNAYLEGCGLSDCIVYAGEVSDVILTEMSKQEGKQLRYCTSDALADITDCLDKVAGPDVCSAFCGEPCEYTQYKYSVLPTAEEDYAEETTLTVRLVQAGFVTVMEEVETYTWFSFLGNVGGMLGLFTGASLLSIAHLFFHCICYPIEEKIRSMAGGNKLG